MRNLLLTLQFDGTNYHGWQVQENAVTVQRTLQDSIEKVTQKRENLYGCSRTDTGVHANMYCCNIKTESSIECSKFLKALNTKLPYDIVITDCKEVPLDFHARYNCKSKQYIYKIYNGQIRSPFLHGYSFYYKYPLDADMLNAQAQDFIGTYDYCSFSSIKRSVEDTVRTIKYASVKREDDMVVFTVEGDGFLYNMVRIMVGTLLRIQQGKIEQGTIKEIIESKQRNRAGITVPGYGLYLNKVNYGGDESGSEITGQEANG